MTPTIITSHRSPNHNPRDGAAISLIVLHATAGEFASSLAWLCSRASKVSCHYLISKSGLIYQLVPDDRAAWHAGASQWFELGSVAIRQRSIGIELVNTNTGRDPYSAVQREAARDLCRALVARYAIVPDMLVRHSDIAMPRGRKSDPAGFPWTDWKQSVFATTVSPLIRTVKAGPRGAIAQQDRTPSAPTAGVWYPPGSWIQVDDLTADYWHAQDGTGFIPRGQVEE